MTIDRVAGAGSNPAGTGPVRTLRDVETAAALRGIISQQAAQTFSEMYPGKIIGRIVDVDLVALKAMVWIVGDDAPIEVSLFSNNIPGKWTARYNSAIGLPDTPTQGYGSMVALEQLNGKIYVTDVLTGGSFAKELESLDLSVAERVPSYDPPKQMLSSTKKQTLMNMVILDGLTDCLVNEAVMFGPFLNASGTMESSTLKMTVRSSQCDKTYQFVFNPGSLTNAFSPPYYWWTILPVSEISERYLNGGDFDLEVCPRYQTRLGDDINGNEQDEVWFRIINKNPLTDAPVYRVTIDSTSFQSAVSPQTGQLIQTVDTKPARAKGYIGVQDNDEALYPIDRDGGFDVFARTVASGSTALGDTDTNNVAWNTVTSGTTVSADGESAIMTAAATNFLSYTTINQSAVADAEIYLEVWAPALPLTQNIQLGATFRYSNTSNNYRIGLEFLASPAGNVRVAIGETVGGVANHALATGSNNISTPLTDRVHLRAQIIGSTLRGKLWFNDNVEPEAWAASVTDASITTPGETGIFVRQASGGTNTFPLQMKFREFRMKPIMYENLGLFRQAFDSGPFRPAAISLGERLSRSMVHDGTFTWTTSSECLTWTSKLILQGVGRSRHTLRNGVAWIEAPATGAEIPFFNGGEPSGTVSTATVTSTGIPLDPGQSLWCALVPGTGFDNLNTKLFIVDTDLVGDIWDEFDVPEWCVFIAGRAKTSSSIHIVKTYDGKNVASVTVEDVEAASANIATTTPSAISPTCGIAFVAPLSGRVKVFMSALGIAPSAGNWTLAQFIVREGSTVGSGTTFLANSNDSSVQWDVPNANNFGGEFLVTGLTPGALYNAEMLNRGNTNTTRAILRRRIIVTPTD